MVDVDRRQLQAQLRNAEKRLAQAENAQINTVAAQHTGYAGTGHGGSDATAELNERIADATGVEDLRAEVMRLRAELGADADPPSLLTRVRRMFSGG